MSSYQKLLRIKKNDKPIKRFGSLLYRLAVPPPPPILAPVDQRAAKLKCTCVVQTE